MYQIRAHAGAWPALDLTDFLDFLGKQLKLNDEDLITLVFADDAFVQSLNQAHRGQDKPTNVLSYASDIAGELGDLIFALETVSSEAETQRKTFDQHLKHLILHGSLHLLGYDHETQPQAAEMEALETQTLAEIGIPDPYS